MSRDRIINIPDSEEVIPDEDVEKGACLACGEFDSLDSAGLCFVCQDVEEKFEADENW